MNINSVTFSDDEKMIRISAGSPNSPGDIYTYDLSTNKLNKITSNLNSDINPNDLVNAEVIRYKSFDGLEIPAILYKPHSAKKGNKVPAEILIIFSSSEKVTLLIFIFSVPTIFNSESSLVFLMVNLF